MNIEVSTVAIPVRVKNGNLEFLHGGPLPKLKEGKLGILELPADAFEKLTDAEALSFYETIEVLEMGTTLHAHISNGANIEPPKGLIHLRDVSGYWGTGSFAPLILEEPLRLTFRGTKKPAFEPCLCKLPALDKNVKSLNEAYTRLSEHYEPRRRSHTGNVFEKVVFQPKGGRFWFPLGKLRDKYQLAFEEKHFCREGGLFGTKQKDR